jgi:hypothetical protein
VIFVKAAGFAQFLAAHGTFRAAGVTPTASGGNEMRVPDDTSLDVLRAVAETGATVYADLAEPEPAVVSPPEISEPKPARKTATRRKTSRE